MLRDGDVDDARRVEERLAVLWDAGVNTGRLTPNEFVRVNPLGLQIAYFRVDQAFEEGRR